MDLSTVRLLSELNRRFYDEHAENFADARPRLPAGAQRVLARIPPGARVLEVGSGDGKVARALARAGVGAYVGVDQSAAMLARVRRYAAAGGPPEPELIEADVSQRGWDSALPPHPFDWILAFAVLHHVPGHAVRTRLVGDVARHLAPGGFFVMSNWQFNRSERLRQRQRPWAAAGLEATAVEPGDCLLAWERKGTHGLRYVHALDEAEARGLAQAAGLAVVEVFRADGVSNDLADYVVMQAPA